MSTYIPPIITHTQVHQHFLWFCLYVVFTFKNFHKDCCDKRFLRPCRNTLNTIMFLFAPHYTLLHCCCGLPFFWLLSFIYLLLDFLQMGKVLFRILVRANRRGGKQSTSCNNGSRFLTSIFQEKDRFHTWLSYLSDYASNGMSLLQIYLNPFPDAFLDGIFGTPGSSKFVVIESVN